MGELKLDTPPEKWTCPLENSGWKMIHFLLKCSLFWGFHTSNCPGTSCLARSLVSTQWRYGACPRPGWGGWRFTMLRTHGCVVYTVYVLKWFFPTTTSLTGWKIPIFIRTNTSSNGWFAIVSSFVFGRGDLFTPGNWWNCECPLFRCFNPPKEGPIKTKGHLGSRYIFTCLFAYILLYFSFK